ncbi:MAG: peroxiredoxin [Intrasporangium sp.]|uniref:peroxiredoxin n=1 Tax=Intrasporangium sp. TaxID=1925024 RepID=UPI0026472F2D|nr:peroxiredoxin [Intrasporangium sp.]MDN5796146.1 peroxiredoxin [Intrasporangium sp.]
MSDLGQVPDVGDLAPDFTLRDHHGVSVSLAGLQDRTNVALVFFPFAFSGICTGELREIRDGLEDFQHDGIQVLAISCDPMYSLRAWADAEGYFFPLLTDFWPHGEVTRRYGVLDEKRGAPLRATFLLDTEGRVVWRAVGALDQRRDFGPYRAALADLRSSTR